MDRSPYAPPTSEIAGGAAALPPTPPSDKVDLGAALSYPMQTPDWWKKCLMVGLFMFIPFVGMVALMGWMRRIFEQVRAGQPGHLPDFNFGEDLGRGWRPFGALFFTVMILYLTIVIFVGGAMGIGAAINAMSPEAGEVFIPILMILGQFIYMGILMAFNVYITEVWRIGMSGRLFPPGAIGESFRAVKASPMPYVIATVGMFVAGMIGSIGGFACFIGMIITLPMAWAMMAHLVGQWDRVVSSKLNAG